MVWPSGEITKSITHFCCLNTPEMAGSITEASRALGSSPSMQRRSLSSNCYTFQQLAEASLFQQTSAANICACSTRWFWLALHNTSLFRKPSHVSCRLPASLHGYQENLQSSLARWAFCIVRAQKPFIDTFIFPFTDNSRREKSMKLQPSSRSSMQAAKPSIEWGASSLCTDPSNSALLTHQQQNHPLALVKYAQAATY